MPRRTGAAGRDTTGCTSVASGPTSSEAYVRELIEGARTAAIPELVTGAWSAALHRVHDRGGVGVIAVAASSLNDAQRAMLHRFVVAQYLDAGLLDAELTFQQRLGDESVSQEAVDTVHIVAFSSDDGRLLGSLSLLAPPSAPSGARMTTRARPILPIEEWFGWGVFNRLAVLPDLPLARVRELGRFVKRQDFGPLRLLGVRIALEVCVAAARTLSSALALSVEAFVANLDDAGLRLLEFLHTPMVVLSGGLPQVPPGNPLRAALVGRDRHLIATLTSDWDTMEGRVAAIETALAKPDAAALLALKALADAAPPGTSSLWPRGGIPALSDTPLSQRDASLVERHHARALGTRIRAFAPFAALSDAEATVLGTLLERQELRPLDPILTRGRPSHAMFLILRGQAKTVGYDRTSGPGDCIGVSSLLTGSPCAMDIVARSRMEILRCSEATYRRFLRELPDVDLALHRLALSEDHGPR